MNLVVTFYLSAASRMSRGWFSIDSDIIKLLCTRSGTFCFKIWVIWHKTTMPAFSCSIFRRLFEEHFESTLGLYMLYTLYKRYKSANNVRIGFPSEGALATECVWVWIVNSATDHWWCSNSSSYFQEEERGTIWGCENISVWKSSRIRYRPEPWRLCAWFVVILLHPFLT